MDYQERFTDADIEKIIEEGLIYMCACPAQVAEALRKVRELHRYQIGCIRNPQNNSRVHEIIAATSLLVHEKLQDCLDEILELEQWDRQTLTMPPGLRERQAREITNDSQFFDLPEG